MRNHIVSVSIMLLAAFGAAYWNQRLVGFVLLMLAGTAVPVAAADLLQRSIAHATRRLRERGRRGFTAPPAAEHALRSPATRDAAARGGRRGAEVASGP
jgi:hypothetical protein